MLSVDSTFTSDVILDVVSSGEHVLSTHKRITDGLISHLMTRFHRFSSWPALTCNQRLGLWSRANTRCTYNQPKDTGSGNMNLSSSRYCFKRRCFLASLTGSVILCFSKSPAVTQTDVSFSSSCLLYDTYNGFGCKRLQSSSFVSAVMSSKRQCRNTPACSWGRSAGPPCPACITSSFYC